jgi:hypothetical protein
MASQVLELPTKPAQKAKRVPPAGTVTWLNDCIARSKREMVTEVTTVTPGLAEIILDLNPDNRNIKPIKLGQYASDMLAGRWTFNGETIKITKCGLLNDGQHRLRAVVEAGTPQPFLFVFGVDRDTRTTLDQGAARTAGDYLTMDGFHFGTLAAGMARLIMAYEKSKGKTIGAAKDYTNAQIVERVKNDPKIIDAARFAASALKFTKGLVIPSVVGACFYLLSEEHAADADEYMHQVCYGENIRRGDPAFAVRTALSNIERPDKAARMEMIFRGWNAYRQNRPLSLAKSLGVFPELV